MGDIREFYLATTFVAAGMVLCWVAIRYTAVREEAALFQAGIVGIGGYFLGILLILLFASICLILSRFKKK